MFADVLPPPTFCFDWYLLSGTSGLIAFFAAAASVVTAFVVLARRGRPARNFLLLFACLGLFVLADLLVYFIGINLPRPRPSRNVDIEGKETVTPTD